MSLCLSCNFACLPECDFSPQNIIMTCDMKVFQPAISKKKLQMKTIYSEYWFSLIMKERDLHL